MRILESPLKKFIYALLCNKVMLLAISWVSLRSTPIDELKARFTSRIPLFSWDSLHYLDILNNGYPRGAGHLEQIAFFPLYPLMSWPLARLVGGPIALLLVSNAASIAGYLLFFKWCKRRSDPQTALFACLAAISYPPAFFASCAYTEGLFVLAVASVLLLMDMRKLLAAALVAGVASAVRPPAVLLGLMVSWASVHLNNGVHWGGYMRRLATVFPIALIGLSGAIAYEGYLTIRFDNPFAYLTAQRNWDTEVSQATNQPRAATMLQPTTGLARHNEAATSRHWYAPLLGKLASIGAWNKFWMGVILALTIWAIWRPGPVPLVTLIIPIGIFLVGYVPGHGARVSSVGRFLVAALPTFLFLGVHIKRYPRLSLAGMSACWLMQCAFVWEFSQGSWAG
jgi:hypothetical protein